MERVTTITGREREYRAAVWHNGHICYVRRIGRKVISGFYVSGKPVRIRKADFENLDPVEPVKIPAKQAMQLNLF